MKSRVVVVEKVYHQSACGQPLLADSGFSRQLDSEEDPYTRRLRVTSEWQPLDTGWVHDAGMLKIENEKGGATIEVSYSREPEWLILPGESLRAHPANARGLWLRSVGEARVTVHLFPG